MALLNDLPTEILAQIFSLLVNDKPLLCKVAVQCHRFNLVIQPILWNHVEVHLNSITPPKMLDRMARSISEAPWLCSLVQSLSLSRNTGTVEGNEKTEGLLERLTALRTLKFQVSSNGPCFKHLYLKSNEMKHLSDVFLNDIDLTIASVADYMFLENLQRLSVRWLKSPRPTRSDLLGYEDREWDIPKLPKCHLRGSSSVTNLDLGSIVHLPMPIWKEILTWPKALKILRSMLPGEELTNRFGVTKSLTSPLSPAGISETLMVVKDSLEDLELIDIGCEWPSHDGTKMDLNNFSSLVKVNVSSTCFFRNFTYGAKRDGLYKLFPPSLVELKIMYDLNDCIRPDEEERGPLATQPFELETLTLEPPRPETPRDLNWLMEFAQNKSNSLSSLKKITLVERCGHLRPGVFPTNWKPPPTIAEAFGVAGIEFRVVMRTWSAVPTFD